MFVGEMSKVELLEAALIESGPSETAILVMENW